jgi:phage terminase Nu1 subunit (DNA packaging protein)
MEVGGLDLVQERAALAREQRHGIELKNAVARGEFAPIALLSEVLATASMSVVERFEQLPGALKKTCPDLPEAARDQVMGLLANARNEWVRSTAELVSSRIGMSDDGDDEIQGVDL